LGEKRAFRGFGRRTSAAIDVFRYSRLMELIFEIRDAEEGGFYARALGHGIFTQGETWDELRGNVLEAVSLHFENATTRPRLVQMHYVKDELIPLEAA
jgi:predicted RNase H-like HicB family nuclease